MGGGGEKAMTVELWARDDYNRLQASAVFKRTWRWNDVLDKRQYGWRVVENDRGDFGDADFFFELPLGLNVGTPASGLFWERAQ